MLARDRAAAVFKRGDRGVGYYEDPLARGCRRRGAKPAEPTSEADAADDSDAVLERLKAKLRQDVDAAAAPTERSRRRPRPSGQRPRRARE